MVVAGEELDVKKLCYSVAMSLDGYIAGPKGEADWIVVDPEIDFRALFARFDTILIGRKTYEWMRASHGGPATPGMQTWLFSTTLKPKEKAGVTLVADKVKERLTARKKEPGKDIWLMGGGSLFSSLLGMKLVDRVETAIVPVVLGGGIPFLLPPARKTKLKLEKQRVYEKSGIVSLEYAVKY
jgi:dihydrofolate reductase